ncbi:MAG: S41 family peptidase [Sphingobacterium sp.]
MKKNFLGPFLILVMLLTVVSCKKDPAQISPPPRPGGDGDRTSEQRVLDSVYSKYKKLSYWESSIEIADPISDLTDSYTHAEGLLSYLKSQTPKKTDYVVHPEYSGPLDRFSWIEDLDGGTSSSARADLADGYGLYLTFDGSKEDSLFVYFVEGGSPGAEAGIKRGQRVIQMEGDSAMVYSNLTNITDYIEGNKLNITVYSESKGELDLDLTYTTYDIDPIVQDTIYQRGNDRIGYLALSSFEEMQNDNGSPTPMHQNLERIFDAFGAGGKKINELIIDLRYNGGGYVSTASYLANKIINPSGNEQVMFSYDVNKNLETEREQGDREFADEVFKRANNLELQRVYFLVTDYTASASEIVIAALMPYMDVQIIADGRATYGKPVGFFREDILGDIGLWAASFKIVNADGYSDYWDGIPASRSNVFDNFYRDFGDPTESMTKAAIDHITTGTFSAKANDVRASSRAARGGEGNTKKLNTVDVQGMRKSK